MVAITVILAAVIASFVFGMSGSITKTKIVAATVHQPTQNTIVVTYQGGQDAQSFSYGSVVVTSDGNVTETIAYVPPSDTATTPTSGKLTNTVGSTVTATGTFAQKNHVVVVGYFTDSTQQVIIDTYV